VQLLTGLRYNFILSFKFNVNVQKFIIIPALYKAEIHFIRLKKKLPITRIVTGCKTQMNTVFSGD
jgi:hypothetical protein